MSSTLNGKTQIEILGPFFNPTGYKFRGKGFSGTAIAGQTTNIQYKLTEKRAINGVGLILQNHVFGDRAHLEIVDVDNILGYGAGTILDRFAEDWYMDPGVAKQGPFILDYSAEILANLYLRVAYTSVGGTNVDIQVNAWLHKMP